jgi:hypothetical protein
MARTNPERPMGNPEGKTAISGRNIRLALARKAIADLETEQDGDRRLELMRLIERLTSGRRIAKKRKPVQSPF